MKITEGDLRKWFPKDNRFLHYCAKYYGYSFYNADVVDAALHKSALNIMRLVNNETEFKDEAEMTAMVMSCFRYGILNSYNKTANEKNLEVYSESQVTYGNDEEKVSKYEQALVSYDKQHNNLIEVVSQFVDTNLPYLERKCFTELVLGDSTKKELSDNLEISYRKIDLAERRAIRKVKNYVRELHTKEENVTKPNNQQEYIDAVSSKLRISTQLESVGKDEKRERDYSEAMSFLHTL
jgi:DNA-directed RNA polymerase specialized sigma24 family protein